VDRSKEVPADARAGAYIAPETTALITDFGLKKIQLTLRDADANPSAQRPWSFQVNDEQEKTRDSLAYRIAVRLFDSAFVAFDRLPRADQQLLLREVMKRALQYMPNEVADKPSEPPDRLNAPPDSPKPVRIIGVEIKRSDPRDDDT